MGMVSSKILINETVTRSIHHKALDQKAYLPKCKQHEDPHPLHWAAAINNLHGLTLLLRAGANRDIQTEEEETPLFLAAKEGGERACQLLLDYAANRDITDHMDR